MATHFILREDCNWPSWEGKSGEKDASGQENEVGQV